MTLKSKIENKYDLENSHYLISQAWRPMIRVCGQQDPGTGGDPYDRIYEF
jgi:hypothetical protein